MRVLIVGAGIAGPTLAYWLSRIGYEPTLVERAPAPRRGGYLVDFWGAGFDVAERMGIVPELRARGYRFVDARSVDRNGRRIASFSPEAFLVSGDRYVTIARSDLAAAMLGALQGRVETIFDDSVEALDDDGGRVHVTFSSGTRRGCPADGPHRGRSRHRGVMPVVCGEGSPTDTSTLWPRARIGGPGPTTPGGSPARWNLWRYT